MGESCKLNIEWKKPSTHTKKHILDDGLYLCKVPKQVRYNLVLEVCTMITCEGRVITRRGPKSAPRALVKYWFLIQVLVTWVCLFCKNPSHCTLDLCVNLYICYCNKNLTKERQGPMCLVQAGGRSVASGMGKTKCVTYTLKMFKNTKIFTKHQQRLSLNNWIKDIFFFVCLQLLFPNPLQGICISLAIWPLKESRILEDIVLPSKHWLQPSLVTSNFLLARSMNFIPGCYLTSRIIRW